MKRVSVHERVDHVGLDRQEVIVFGSSVMELLGLREAESLNLVVTHKTMDDLKKKGEKLYVVDKNGHPEEMFTFECEDGYKVNIWTITWDPDKEEQIEYEDLLKDTTVIDGIRCMTPEWTLKWKEATMREKDIADIALLEGYLARAK